MTGKLQKAEGRRQKAVVEQTAFPSRRNRFLPAAYRRLPCALLGFTLLELMIVITVIIILAAIVLPQYQKTILATREAVLREDLSKLRTLIDHYASDKQKLPESLDTLVADGYIREVPKDPMTGNTDWTPDVGEDPNLPEGGQGLLNIHSASTDAATDGTHYNEW